jgi:choline dehydrogenase-like flavoprotein
MIVDLSKVAGIVRRRTEVCVIGAGAAGITVARRLLAEGHDVLLLESGGIDYERPIADLNGGQNIGQDYYSLDDARLRFFGGTTAIWGGRCATLDPIDLERRAWVPSSGWPLSWEDLQAYYAQARGIFGLDDLPPTSSTLKGRGVPLPSFDPSELRTPIWSFDPRFNRFTFDACEDLRSHPRCQIVIHASVTRIIAENGHVARIEARSLNGSSLDVDARAYVLAAGGIENARLLLASSVGNERDQVGRYFMEHPHARGGHIVDARVWPLLKAFGRRHRVDGQDLAALITPSPDLQRREGLLNTSLTIVARQPADARPFLGMRAYKSLKHDLPPTRSGRRLWMAAKKIANWGQRHVDPLRPWLLHKAGRLEVALLVRAEQAPNPESRVLLSPDRDALGMPRVALDWRLSALDKHSVTGLVDALGRELQRLKLGTVKRAAWLEKPELLWKNDPLISSHSIGGYHHIGTTRMSNDPREGVVNGDGRVHSVGNLYIVGSSIFATSSWANPTLTIAALALRTADRLSARLRRLVSSPGDLQAGMARAS